MGTRQVRGWIRIGVVAAAVAGAFALASGMKPRAGLAPSEADVVVYKTPACACCDEWIDHVRGAGYTVATVDQTGVELVQTKAANGVPAELGSCHTAVVAGYVVEGHVPVDAVRRLLDERPDVAGLVLPGMPAGSPGMGGDQKDGVDILAIQATGETVVFEHVPGSRAGE